MIHTIQTNSIVFKQKKKEEKHTKNFTFFGFIFWFGKFDFFLCGFIAFENVKKKSLCDLVINCDMMIISLL